MSRHIRATLVIAGVLIAFLAAISHETVRSVVADISGVTANAPSFGPGQPLTITVNAEDDSGDLTIVSDLPNSTLTVTNCTGVVNQTAGRCDGTGMGAVSGQGTTYVAIDTGSIDADGLVEPLIVTLTLTASCSSTVDVTVSANQPGNAGPDQVTIHCAPPTPTPTLTPTPTQTFTPTPTSTATLTPTSTPAATSTPTITTLQLALNPATLFSQGSGSVIVRVWVNGSPAPDGTLVTLSTSVGTLTSRTVATFGGQASLVLQAPATDATLAGEIVAVSGSVQAQTPFTVVPGQSNTLGVNSQGQPAASPPQAPLASVIRPPSTGTGNLVR